MIDQSIEQTPVIKINTLALLAKLYTLIQKHWLHWFGHVNRMPDTRIPNVIIYGGIATGKEARGRPHLPFKDVCKKDIRSMNMVIEVLQNVEKQPLTLETRCTPRTEARRRETEVSVGDKRPRRKVNNMVISAEFVYTCICFSRDCVRL